MYFPLKPLKFGCTYTMKNNKHTGIALIKKSNDLIEAQYKFDIWETRFFLSVLGKIHKDDSEFETYRIYYKDIINTFGLKPTSSYELLRTAARSLMDKKVTVDYEENGHKREKIYHLIRHIDLLKEGRVGASDIEQQEYVDVVVESQMRPLLLHLQKNFTAYDLRNIVNLGVYPVRVYELLKQYETFGKRLLLIDDVKKMFHLTMEYPKFSNFYQYTDIKITKVEKIKEGKKIVALKFFFEKKASDEIKFARKDLPKEKQPAKNLFDTFEEIGTEYSPVLNSDIEKTDTTQNETDRLFTLFHQVVVRDFGVSPSVFLAELPAQSEESILQAVRVTQRAISNKKANNSAAFFIDALRKGFTDPQEVKTQKKAQQAEIKAHNDNIMQRIAEITDIKLQAINDKIRALTTANPDITTTTINDIRTNQYYAKIIAMREKESGITLTVQDFRDDKVLRTIFKEEIVKASKSEFIDIEEGYNKQIELLKKQLR
jgi:Initiator Replication protein